MTLYYSLTDPLDVRDLGALHDLWVEVGNPKAGVWAVQPTAPSHDPATHRAEWTAEAEWVLVEIVPPVHAISKLTLMRRLDALGKWADFKTLMSQLPEPVRDAWDLALEIRSDDAMFVANAATITTALGLTEAQYEALLAPMG
jgi:hypothetical protein